VIRDRFDRVTLIREGDSQNHEHDLRRRSALYRTSADCVAVYEIGKVRDSEDRIIQELRSPTLTSEAILIVDEVTLYLQAGAYFR